MTGERNNFEGESGWPWCCCCGYLVVGNDKFHFAVKEFGRGHASLKMVKLDPSAIGCRRHVIDIGPTS